MKGGSRLWRHGRSSWAHLEEITPAQASLLPKGRAAATGRNGDGPVRERKGSPSFPYILRYDRLFRRAAVNPTLVDDFKENSVRSERGPRRLVDQLAKTRIVRALEMSHRRPLCNVNELERCVGRYCAMEFVT